MEKINFVCNPRIIAFADNYNPADPFAGVRIPLEEFLASDLWNKQLSHEIVSTPLYPVTILEIVLTRNEFFYTARIRQWDGIGVYETNITYDHDDKRIETERDYLTL